MDSVPRSGASPPYLCCSWLLTWLSVAEGARSCWEGTPGSGKGQFCSSLHPAKCNIPVWSVGNCRLPWAVKAGQGRPRTLHLLRKLNVSSGWECCPLPVDFLAFGLSCIDVPRLWCPSEITKDWRQQRRGVLSPFLTGIFLCVLRVSPSEGRAWLPRLDPLRLVRVSLLCRPALERQRFQGCRLRGRSCPPSKAPSVRFIRCYRRSVHRGEQTLLQPGCPLWYLLCRSWPCAH